MSPRTFSTEAAALSHAKQLAGVHPYSTPHQGPRTYELVLGDGDVVEVRAWAFVNCLGRPAVCGVRHVRGGLDERSYFELWLFTPDGLAVRA